MMRITIRQRRYSELLLGMTRDELRRIWDRIQPAAEDEEYPGDLGDGAYPTNEGIRVTEARMRSEPLL